MKLNITSLSDKRVRCKVYDLNGKRRKVLCKGKFLHNVTQEIEPKHGEIIVRICRSVSPLSFLYVWLIEIMETLGDFYSKGNKLNYLWEIKISKLNAGDTIDVVYTNAVPETSHYYGANRTFGEPDALYCSSHPSKKVKSFIRKQIWIQTLFGGISAIVIVVAICLIYFKCIGAY